LCTLAGNFWAHFMELMAHMKIFVSSIELRTPTVAGKTEGNGGGGHLGIPTQGAVDSGKVPIKTHQQPAKCVANSHIRSLRIGLEIQLELQLKSASKSIEIGDPNLIAKQ
jgi:hypothetical protein